MKSFKELGNITTTSTKRYHNCIDKLYKLTYCDRYLLDWLAEVADEDNRVFLSKPNRNDFIIFTKRLSSGEVNYSDNTIRNSVMNLKKEEFIISIPGEEARYWVNPLYFCKYNHERRNNLVAYIQRQLEENNILV